MKKIKVWMDSIVAVIFLILAAVMYYESAKISTDESFAMNPASYPYVIISIIVLLALILLVGEIKKGLTKKAFISEAAIEVRAESSETDKEIAPNYKNPLKIIVLLIAYGFGLAYLGFIVSTFVMIIAGTLLLGYRSYLRMTIAAIIVTLVVYSGFTYLLLVRFPSGLLF